MADAERGGTPDRPQGVAGGRLALPDILSVVFVYAAFAVAWIILSDALLNWLVSDPAQAALLGTLKGWFFVAVTALLLYFLLRRLRDNDASRMPARGALGGLAGVLLPVAAVVVAVVGASIVQSYQRHGKEGGERLRAVAELKREQLASWLVERRADAHFLHTSGFLAGRYQAWRLRGDGEAGNQMLARLGEFRRNFRYERILLVDRHGVYADDGKPADDEQELAVLANGVVAEGRVELRGPYRGSDGRAHIDFIVPLGVGSTKTGAAVVLRVDPADALDRVIRFWPLPSLSGEALLFRREGDDVLFLSGLRHRRDAALNLRVPVAEPDMLAARVLRGDAAPGALIEGVDYRRIGVLGLALPIEGSDWLLVVKEDRTEIYAGALRDALWIVLLGGMAMLISFIGAFLLRQQRELAASRREQEVQAEKLRALQLLDAVAAGSTDVIIAKDCDGHYLLFNGEAGRVTGRAADEVLGHDDTLLFPPEQAARLMADDRKIMAGGCTVSYEESLTTAVGEVTYHSTKGPLRDGQGRIVGIFGISRDITEKAKAETVLRSVNRALRTLSESSLSMLHAESEEQLFEAICTVAVTHGGYRMAWAGIAGDDAARTVRPIAQAGFEAGYLDSIHVSWGDDPLGGGPTGTAIRERRPVVARNILTDPHFVPWREAAVRRGYASSIALPLVLDDICFGALNIYASEADAFDADEVQLLTQLATDLAHGLRALRDRAAKTEAEAALRETAERLARLVDASATVLYSLRPVDGVLVPADVSGNLTRIFGYTIDEALQPGWWERHLHPEDAAAAKAAGARLAETGQLTHEYRFAHKDGGYLWVRDIMRLLCDADGQVSEVVGVWLDVSERRRTEAELERLSQAVEQSSESIIITNVDDVIEYVNQAFLDITGYDRDEVLGRTTDFLVTGQPPAPGYFSLRAALSRGEDWKGELLTRRKDGSEFVEFAVVSPVRSQDGRITHYVGVKEDITEKKRIGEELDRHRRHLEDLVGERTRQLQQAKEEAEAASRAKSAFLANVSHEIRTPMNAIVGLAHLLQQSGLAPEQAERLQKINVAAYQLLSIVNDVLDLSKIEAGRLTLAQTSFAVATVVDYVRSMIFEPAAAKSLLIETDVGEAPAWLRGDPTRLRQALLNLAGNAVKFTEHGSITLRARLLDETDGLCLVRFEVQDTGIGISAGTLQKLFEPFEQGDASTTRRFGGTGLGLAITQQLAQAMGGDAGAESEPGRGSLFWFTARLPKAAAGAQEATLALAGAVADELRQRCAGARVLLAEDNPINREVAQELLFSAGLQVTSASNGREAVNLAASETFDLVLMDVQMPELDGIGATRLIRALPAARSLPIVAMTANAFEEDRQRCLACGMNDFIAKPIDPPRFYAMLQQWLPASGKVASPEAGGQTGADTELRARLAAIPGLDLEQGLSVALGRVDRLVRLLRLFADSHGRDAAALQAAVAANDLVAVKHVAHALKGAAGTLGALAVQAAATDLLAAVNDQAVAVLPSGIERLIGELEPLLAGIAQLADGSTPLRRVDPVKLDELLDSLREMLVRGDFAVAELAQREGETLRIGLGSRGDEVLRCIGAFDYTAALALLADQAAGKGQS